MEYRFYGISEQYKAALKRLQDAEFMLNNGTLERHKGAMYLAGYAVECRIKAIAMERHNCSTLDELKTRLGLTDKDVYSHRLEALLEQLLPRGVKQLLMKDEQFRMAFSRYVNKWTPSWRYDGRAAKQGEAEKFVNAIRTVIKKLTASA